MYLPTSMYCCMDGSSQTYCITALVCTANVPQGVLQKGHPGVGERVEHAPRQGVHRDHCPEGARPAAGAASKASAANSLCSVGVVVVAAAAQPGDQLAPAAYVAPLACRSVWSSAALLSSTTTSDALYRAVPRCAVRCACAPAGPAGVHPNQLPLLLRTVRVRRGARRAGCRHAPPAGQRVSGAHCPASARPAAAAHTCPLAGEGCGVYGSAGGLVAAGCPSAFCGRYLPGHTHVLGMHQRTPTCAHMSHRALHIKRAPEILRVHSVCK